MGTANSDRRPVDPPPVVELRIVEGETWDQGKDITFDYNAHFFLYASLEDARQKHPGKGGLNNNPPILTGVPASGMAYLDRPNEAGYFIFPDLSVRHEGYYKLKFSLFETTKEEKDFDLEPADADLPPGVDWRMEIETTPFHVFSAKKFPGLMESTQLSKTVADQGCRVRIRRDVRMRKREGKSGGYDRREEKYSGPRTVTPAPEDPHGIRARSLSNSSEHRTPYALEPQRRPSIVDAAYPPPPPPPPSGYDATQAPRGHLSFGDPSAPQYAAPRQYHPQSNVQLAPMSPSGAYAPVQSPYCKHEPYCKPEVSAMGYVPSRNPSLVASPAQPIKPEIYDRRSSVSTYVPPSPSVYSSYDGQMRRDSHQSLPMTPMMPYPSSRHQMQPIQPSPQHGHYQPERRESLAPLRIAALVSPNQPIEAQTEPLPPPPMIATGGKRKHDYVFSQNVRPLYNGQRQQDPHFTTGRRGYTPEPHEGTYSRADGSTCSIPFNTCTM